MGRGCHRAPTSLIQAARSDCRGQATVTVWPARVPASARERTALAHPPSVGWETWRIRKRRRASADGTSGSRAEVLLMRGGSLLCAYARPATATGHRPIARDSFVRPAGLVIRDERGP